MLRIANYQPDIATPQPDMKVTKSGRTTGLTTGRVTAVGVNGVQVNYGTETKQEFLRSVADAETRLD
jgi:hypothetical protein